MFQEFTGYSAYTFQVGLWIIASLLVGLAMVDLGLQRFGEGSKEPRRDTLANCYKKRKTEDCSVVRDSRDGTLAIIEEVRGSMLPVSSSPVTRVVSAFQKLIHFFMKSVQRTLGETTCELCGSTVCKICTVLISSTNLPEDRDARGNGHRPNSPKKVRQGELLPSGKVSGEGKPLTRKSSLKVISQPSSSSLWVSSEESPLYSPHTKVEHEDSCSIKWASRSHTQKPSRGRMISRSPGKALKVLPHGSRKACHRHSLNPLVPGSTWGATKSQANSGTWSLSSSVSPLPKVAPSEESLDTDVSEPSVVWPPSTSEQLTSCSDQKGLQSDDNGLMTSYSGRTTTQSRSSSPSGKSSLGTKWASNSPSAPSISSLSEDEGLSVCSSNTADSLNSTATETPGVNDCRFPHTHHPSELTSSGPRDSSSLSLMPVGCLLHKAQAAKLGALLRRRILDPLYGLPAPIARSQQWAKRRQIKAGNTSHSIMGLVSETQCCDSILTPPKNAIKQSDTKEFTGMETPFLGNTTRQRLEWHLRKKSFHNVWSGPTTVQASLSMYMPSAPTPTVPKATKKPARFVPAVLDKLPFLHECTRQHLDSHLGTRVWNRRVTLYAKSQDIFKKAILSRPCMSESPSLFYRKTVALSPKRRPASSISGLSEGKTRGSLQGCQHSKVPKFITNSNASLVTVPESKETHLSKNTCDLEKGSIAIAESASMETAHQVTKKLHRKLIRPGRACLKPRTRHISFLNATDVDSLEKNIKHKQLAFLWQIPTTHTECLARTVPAALPALIQSCAPPIKFMEMGTPCMESDITHGLDWHVQDKSLQQEWGLPAMLHGLPGAVVPSAPPVKEPKVHQKHGMKIIIISGAPPFISTETERQLEVHLRKKIRQHQRGLPCVISKHVGEILPPVLPETESLSHTPGKKYLGNCNAIPDTQTQKISDLSVESAYSGDLDEIGPMHKKYPTNARSQAIRRQETHQGVDTEMERVPLQVLSRTNLISAYKPQLPKHIFKGKASVRPRGSSLAFLEQDAVGSLEQNLRHKGRMLYWSLGPHYINAMEMTAPRATPVPLLIKSSGTAIEFTEQEAHCVKSKLREGLECHVQRKLLLPDEKVAATLKKSLTDTLPLAPKIDPKQDEESSFCSEGPKGTAPLHGSPSSIISSESNDKLETPVANEFTKIKLEVQPSVEKESQITMSEGIKPPLSTLIGEGSTCEQPSPFEQPIPKQDDVEDVDRLSSKHSSQASAVSGTSDIQYNDTYQDTHTLEDKVVLAYLHQDSNMSIKDRHQQQLNPMQASCEIQREALPPVMRASHETGNHHKTDVFPKLTQPGERRLQSRAAFFPFTDTTSIDAVEQNLKHKHLMWLLGQQPSSQDHLKELFPESSSLPSLTAGRGPDIEFFGVETNFLKSQVRRRLEWHILKKALHYEWGLPALLQRSLQAFMTLAPDCTHPKTSPKSDVEIVMIREAAFFISNSIRKDLELHAKRRIIHRDVGLPSKVLQSLAEFYPTAPLEEELPSQQVEEDITVNSVKALASPISSTSSTESKVDLKCLDPVVQSRKDMGEVFQLCNCSPVQIRSQMTDALDLHLTKKCIETQIAALPSVVWQSQKALSLPKKGFLPQLIRLGKNKQMPRVSVSTCMDPVRLLNLERNLKHKLLAHQWGLTTRHLYSYWHSSPKPPIIHIPLQATGASIEFSEMGAPFLKSRVRDYLERHVKKKRLQHEWGMPVFLHNSLQEFTPSPPTPIQHRKGVETAIQLIIIREEASFLNDDTRKYLENHVKRRIIQNAFGLPQRILEALSKYHHVAPPLHVHPFLNEEENISGLSFNSSGQAAPEKNEIHKPKTLESSKASEDLVPSALDQLQIEDTKDLQVHLEKKSLEMYMEMISPPVKRSLRAVYYMMKQALPKMAYPRNISIQSRNRFIPFIEPKSLRALEINMKHKHLMFLWGMATLQNESITRMIPGILPLPKALKDSGAGIEFGETTTTFLKPNTRDRLEWHVERKKLYQPWNVPRLVHKSLQAFVPPAPLLERPQTKGNPRLGVLILTGDLFFMDEYIHRNLEKHIKKKIVQKEIGLPQRIVESLKSFIVCTPPMGEGLIHCDDLDSASVQTGKGIMGRSMNLMTHTPLLSENVAGSKVAFLKKHKSLNLRLIRMCCEVRLGAIHSSVKKSWTLAGPTHKPLLFKLVQMGERCAQTRRRSLLFVEQETIDCIQRNIIRKHLMFLWGLPMPHTDSLFKMVPQARRPSQQMHGCRAAIEFSEVDAFFPKPAFRQHLEWHIKVKKLQHEFGLPPVLHRSLKAFMSPISPCVPPHPYLNQTADMKLIPLRRYAYFLTNDNRKHLENHIKKRIVQQMFGLPLKILESLKGCIPIPPMAFINLTQTEGKKTAHPHAKATGIPGHPKIWTTFQQDVGMRCTENFETNMSMNDLCHHNTNLERLELKMTKKCLEVKTGAIPLMVKMSEITRITLPNKPLPRLPAVCKSPTLRIRWPMFMERCILELIERNLRCKYLACLLGIPSLYVKSLESMVPKSFTLPPLVKAKGANIEFTEQEMPFLNDKIREHLERHVGKKRLQRALGLPAKIQKSFERFMPLPLALPDPIKKDKKPVVAVVVLAEMLFFISRVTQYSLDFHLKRVRVQQRYGLPVKILNSLKRFMPSTPQGTEYVTHHLVDTGREFMEGLMNQRSRGAQEAPGTEVVGPMYPKTHRMLPCPMTSSPKPHLGKIQWPHIALENKYREVQQDMLPSCVMESWKLVYPLQIDTLPKMAPSGQICNMPRSAFLSFLKRNTVDRINLNLAHKYLMFLFGLPTDYAESLKTMIPQASLLSIPARAKRAVIKFTDMPTTFLRAEERNTLERYIQRKKLQNQWTLPAVIQRSFKAFAPIPPKLSARKLKPHTEVTINTAELEIMDEDTKNQLESGLCSRSAHQTFGLPKKIQTALKKFTLPAPLKDQLPSRNRDGGSMFGLSRRRNANVSNYRVTRKQVNDARSVAHDFGKCFQTSLPESALTNEVKDKLQFHLVKRSIELRLGVVDSLVRKSHEGALLGEHTHLPKIIVPGEKGIRMRPQYFIYMESAAIHGIDLNLKQKKLAFLWGVPSQHTPLLFTMMPKASPLDLRAKPSGATIEFSPAETPFLTCKLRLHLEWHVKKKRLQQRCRLPLEVEQSMHLFIPSTYELFGSRCHKGSDLNVLPVTSELLFINEDTQEGLEFHVKKLIAQKRFGLSGQIKDHLRKLVLAAPPITEQAPDEDIKPSENAFLQVSKTLQATRGCIGSPETLPLLSAGESQCNKKLEHHLTRKCLEVKMGVLPFVAEWSSRIAFPAEQTNLPRQIVSKQNCNQRPMNGFFLEPQDIHQVDLNIKHKQMMSLWGLRTHAIEPLKISMPALFFMPQIQTKGLCIEFSDMDTPFIDSTDRETLEWHVKNKCLHQDWGLPAKIQRSLTVFMQQAPNQLQPKASQSDPTDLLIKSSDVLFLTDYTKKKLEKHTKRFLMHLRKTCPKKIAETLKLLQFTVSGHKTSTADWDSDKPFHPQSLLRLCFKKSTKITPSVKHAPLSPGKEVKHSKLLFGRSVSRHDAQKGSLLPRGVQQQWVEKKLQSSRVGSLMSKQLAQSCKVQRYRYMTWKNRKRKVVPSSPSTNSISSTRTQCGTSTRRQTADSIGCSDPTYLTTAVDSGCKYPPPDINDIHEIAQAVEVHLQKRLSHLPPSADKSVKLCKPMAPPSFPGERGQQYATIFNACVPNFTIPPSISELKKGIDLHLREKTIEIHFDVPCSVRESSNSTNRWLGLLLNSLPPKIHISTSLGNEDIANCQGLTQSLSTSAKNDESCVNGTTFGISTANENQIMHNLETAFTRQTLEKYHPCAPQKNMELGTPLPFQSSHGNCLDYPYIVSDNPPHEPPKPFSFPALKILDDRMVDRLSVYFQSSCESLDPGECPDQSDHQNVRREMESDRSRQSRSETTSINTPSKPTNHEPSLWVSLFHHSVDVKRNLEAPVQQKMIMNTLVLPLCVDTSGCIHQRMLPEREREEAPKIKAKGIGQHMETESDSESLGRKQSELVNSNEHLFLEPRKTKVRALKFPQDIHNLTQVFRCEAAQTTPSSTPSPKDGPIKEHPVVPARLREQSEEIVATRDNISSQNPGTCCLSPRSPLSKSTSTSYRGSSESKHGDRTASSIQISSTEESTAESKQASTNNLKCNANTTPPMTKKGDLISDHVEKKTTWFQKVMSSFRKSISKLRARVEEKSATSGVEGLAHALDTLLTFDEAPVLNQKQNRAIPGKDGGHKRTHKTQKRKVELIHPTPNAVQPPKTITAHSSTGDAASRENGSRDEKINLGKDRRAKSLRASPEENQERKGTREARTKENRVPAAPADKEDTKTRRAAEKATSTSTGEEGESGKTQNRRNASWLTCSSSLGNMLPDTSSKYRPHLTEENETSPARPGRVAGQAVEVKINRVRGRRPYSRRVEDWVETLSPGSYRDSSVEKNKPRMRKWRRRHQRVPKDISPPRQRSNNRQRKHCQRCCRGKKHRMEEKLEARVDAKDAGLKLPSGSTSANSADGTNCKAKFIFLEYSL